MILVCYTNTHLNHTQVAAVTDTFDALIRICVYLHIQYMLWWGDCAIERVGVRSDCSDFSSGCTLGEEGVACVRWFATGETSGSTNRCRQLLKHKVQHACTIIRVL